MSDVLMMYGMFKKDGSRSDMGARADVHDDAVMTSKGQVTRPVEMRRHPDLKPGDRPRSEATTDRAMRVSMCQLRDAFGVLAALPPVTGRRPKDRAGVLAAVDADMAEKFGTRRRKGRA